jgi:hypothetical protein
VLLAHYRVLMTIMKLCHFVFCITRNNGYSAAKTMTRMASYSPRSHSLWWHTLEPGAGHCCSE